MDFVYLVAGLALLVVGGQLLVGGASSLAQAFRIPPLIIGLTVIAYGTSAPELAVSLQAALGGTGDVAVGNVLGSNICNILFILGLAAMIRPLIVEPQLVRLDVPFMVFISGVALFMAWDGVISRIEGMLLFLGAIVYTAMQIKLGLQSREEEGRGTVELEGPKAPRNAWEFALRFLYIGGGFALLVFGADMLVGGAVGLARMAGVSELVIGLTIVAGGTSMPEVAATVIATLRKEAAMAVGSVVGSNVFNLLSVLGLTAVIAPGGLAVPMSALTFDFPIMVAVAVACWPIFATGHRIERWEGWLFFGYYIAYVSYLVLAATEHRLENEFRAAFLGFVMPLTAVTLGISVFRHWRERRISKASS